MYGYIYKTTNLTNGCMYVGQHKAEAFDSNYLGSGLLIQRAIKKYGKCNFKVQLLEVCSDQIQLDEFERKYIAELRETNFDLCYNISDGGRGVHGYSHTTATREFIGECSKNRTFVNDGYVNKFIKIDELEQYQAKGWILGRVFSENAQAGIDYAKKCFARQGEKNKGTRIVSKDGVSLRIRAKDLSDFLFSGYKLGYPDSTETHWVTNGIEDQCVSPEKCSLLLLEGWTEGRVTTGVSASKQEEWKHNISNALSGRKLSDEHKQHIGEAKTGQTVDQETRDQISATLKETYKKTPKEEIDRRMEKKRQTIEKNGGRKQTEEARHKLSVSQTGTNNSMYGKHPQKAVMYNGVEYKTISIKNVELYESKGFWRIPKKCQ